MKRLILLSVCLGFSISAFAQNVSVKDGNIQFTNKAGETTALTSSGRDSGPVLSPDGKWIVFVRKVDGKKIATGSNEVEPSELWQVRADGKEATLLLKCRASQQTESVIAAFETLQFSTNGKLLYFVTPAWATSGAVHVVDTRNDGTLAGLADDDVVEVPARVGAGGVEPLPQEPLAPELLGLVQHVAAYERLAAEAATTRDPLAARKALLAHPLIAQVDKVDALIDSLVAEAVR